MMRGMTRALGRRRSISIFISGYSSDYTELVIGAGSRAADLDFRQTSDNTHSEFSGGGIDVFGEWYHPLHAGPVYEFAFVGLGAGVAGGRGLARQDGRSARARHEQRHADDS